MSDDIRFREYYRTQVTELRPYEEGENMLGISIGQEDMKNGSPKQGDMIARSPMNLKDQWLVNKEYFNANFEET